MMTNWNTFRFELWLSGVYRSQMSAVVVFYAAFTFAEICAGTFARAGVKNRLVNLSYGIFVGVAGLFAVGLLRYLVSIPSRVEDPGDWRAVVLRVAGYLVMTDLLFYWYHRLQHGWSALWVVHELHHSDDALNVTSSLRTYWVDRVIQTFLIAAPVELVVGRGPWSLVWFGMIAFAWLCFTHVDLPLSLGRCTLLLAGPQWHRIHHSVLAEHQGKNFAQFFPWLDLLFGTYYFPSPGEFPPTGLRPSFA